MKWYDWFGVVGSLASFVGVGISLYILKTVRRIRQRYVRQAMLESCLSSLKRCRAVLTEPRESCDADRFRESLGSLKGILRRIDLHKPDDLPLQWSEQEIDALIQLDNRQIVARSRHIVARLHDWIVTIDLELTATKWGNEDD